MAGSSALTEISLAKLAEAQDASHPEVVALREACTDTGFFVVTEHPVPSAVVDAAFAASEGFFALPEERKRACVGTQANGWRGFGPYGSGQNCSKNAKRPERKETFYYGAARSAEEKLGAPTVPEPAGFDEALECYYDHLMQLSRTIFRGFSLALGLESDYFERTALRHPEAKVLLACYPPAKEGEFSCGAHTDCGCLTLVCADGSSGLQVQRRDGQWLEVASRRYVFVANIGELMARWTNDIFKSTPHRVLNDGVDFRRSVIFFNNLDADAEVKCLPSCVSEERPAKYAPTTCGEYVRSQLQLMRDDFKTEAKFKTEDIAEPSRGDVVAAELPVAAAN